MQLRADNKVDAERVWKTAMETPGPVLIDFVVSKDELLPMVPHGHDAGRYDPGGAAHMSESCKHTLSVLVRDHPGVLQRIAGLFSSRGYNMESLTVGASEEEGLTRITIALKGSTDMMIQICYQLSKLVDVVDVHHLNMHPMLSRELLLIKLLAPPERRSELFGLVDTFRCSVVDVGQSSVVIQVVGDVDKNNALLQLLSPYDIVELTRTRETAMSRGLG